MHLNAEGHDESQYLPEGVEVVNPFRKQHTSISVEGELHKAIEWLPDILFEKHCITKRQLDTAFTFLRILVNAKKALGTCDLRGVMFDKYPYGISSDVDPFLEIKRKIGKYDFNALIWLVWNDYNRGNISLALQKLSHLKRILDHTQYSLDEINRLKHNATSTPQHVSLNFG